MSVTLTFVPKDKTVTEIATGTQSNVRAIGDRQPASFIISHDGYWLKVDASYCASRNSSWSFNVGIPANDNDFKFPEKWKVTVERSPDRSYLPILKIIIPTANSLADVKVSRNERVVTFQKQTQKDNSFSACVGTLLDLDVIDIPCFWKGISEDLSDHDQTNAWYLSAKEHLAKMGYSLLIVPEESYELGLAMTIGLCKRPAGESCSKRPFAFGLIGSNGELIFDPSTDDRLTNNGYDLKSRLLLLPDISSSSLVGMTKVKTE